jgi:site-specific recombinase XerC
MAPVAIAVATGRHSVVLRVCCPVTASCSRERQRPQAALRTDDQTNGAVIPAWLKEPARGDRQIVSPHRPVERMSSARIQYLLAKHFRIATKHCPWLQSKKVSHQGLRHTSAMTLSPSGVDVTGIALWLGHEAIETTHVYP